MTGRGEHSEISNTTPLDYRTLPLAGRLQTALTLGDLAAAGAKWGHGQFKALIVSRDNGVTRERPSAPCGVF